MTKFITVVLSLVASTALYAQSPSAVRDQIFGETDAVKKQAEDLHAKILAPEAYAEGMKVYLEAVDTMEKGKDLDRVREELAEAKGFFTRSVDASKLAQTTFTQALAARSSVSNSSTPSTRQTPQAFCLSLPPATSTTEPLNRTTIWFRTFRQTSTLRTSFQSRPRIRLMHSQAFPISVR